MTVTEFTRKDVTLANWRQHPFSQWSFQNLEELVPSARIISPGSPEEPVSEPGLIASLSIHDADGTAMPVIEHLKKTHTDHFVVLRGGVVLDEWAAPHAEVNRPHLIFSVSKSITGLLADIAAGDGQLDVEQKASRYVPVRRGSAYSKATVRHLLDMTVSLAFEENYLDTKGAFARYRRSTLWNPQGTSRIETMLDVLASLKPEPHPHGEIYHYASPNTDMLGLVIEAATGRRYHEYLADRLWGPMGARGGAYITVDRIGAPRAAGGICITARDLARLGQLVLDGGTTPDGRELVPRNWIDDIRNNGSRDAWVKGDDAGLFPDGKYRSCWYKSGDERGSFCAIGLHSQWLWIDPTSGIILVKMSSRPVPSDESLSRAEAAFLGQVARGL